jgi:general secretion pathway protein F
MPAYAFEALTPSGQTEKGLLEADTARAARGLLRSRGLVPLVVEPAAAQATDGGTGLNRTLWASRVYGPAALAVWTRQMAGLVAAGLPLERALGALTDEADDDRQRHLLATLRAEVNAGSTSPAPCNSTPASSPTFTPP